MNGRNLYSYFFIWLCISGLVTHSFAQTITTISPTSVCPGGAVTISYTISGTFAAGNIFTAQLSDAAGAFTTPTIIGSVTSTSAGSVNATIPTTANGAGYHIRLVSSAPAATGTASAQALIVNVPSAPGVTPPGAYCQNTPAAALVASGAGLQWYGTNATGGTPSSVATVPSTASPGTVNYYVSQSVGGCESPRAAIPVTVNVAPGAPGVSSFGVCQNASATLTATPAAGGTLNWYGTNATGGTASGTAPVLSTATVGATTYYVSQTVNGCEGPRATITVTVNAIPAAPGVTPPNAYCQGAGAAALVASGTGSLNWYGTSATGGTPSSVATVPSTATPGTVNYYVSQTVNGCESPRASIPVTVKSKPNPPVTAGISFCQGSTPPTLPFTFAPNATQNWYGTSATGGVASPIAPVPANDTPGFTTYYVSQTVDGCESDRASYYVQVKVMPHAPSVIPVSFCLGTPATQLVAAPSPGGLLNWYGTAATGGTQSSTAPTPPTSTVGSTIFYVSQSLDGCEGPRAGLTVTVNAVPAAPSVTVPGAYCQGVPAAPLVASGSGSLNWYGTSATGGTPSGAAPSPITTSAGTFTYYVSQTVNGCESPRASIAVTVNPTPIAPAFAPAPVYCQNASAVALIATAGTGGSLTWYGTSATGGTASTTANVPNTSQPGIFNYYVSQTINGCEGSRAAIPVTVNPTPGAPAVSPVSVCQNAPAVQLTATPSGSGVLNWYGTNATGGTAGTAPTAPTSFTGSTNYYVSQSLNTCEGPRAILTVTIKPLPNAPGVTNLVYCLQTQDQPAQTVPPLNAFGTELKWYNPDGTFTTTAPVPPISQTGVQTYSVSQTYNGCESPNKSTLLVTVGTSALPVAVKSLVTYCINDKAVPLEATGETGGNLRWIDPYGNVTNVAPTPLTLNTSIQAGGDPFYVYQIGSNGCYSARTTIKALVNALPTLSLIPSSTNINLGQRVALQLKFTSAAPFSYTLTDGRSTPTIGLTGVVNRSDTTLSFLPTSTTTYQIVTVKNSCGVGLPGNPATATIAVRVPTITTSALTQLTACVGTSLSVPFTSTGDFNTGNLFRIELVSVADTSKKFSVSGTATASPVTAPLPLTLASGQYYVRVKADNPEIAIIGSNSLTPLTVRSLATVTMTGTQKIYEGYPGSLTFTFGGDGPWTVAYADSVRSYSATATTSPYTAEVRPTRTTTYRLTSVANGCGTGTISGTAVITVLPLLGVDDNSLDPLVKTYPVPTTSILTVELDLPLTRDPATFSLTTMSGRPVLQQTTRNKRHELDLTAQPNGLYLLHIQVGDRQTTRKVLKQ